MRTPFGTPPAPRTKEQASSGNFDNLSKSHITADGKILSPSTSSNSLSNLGKSPSFDKLAGNSSYLGSGSLINAAAVGFGGVSSTSSSFVEISNLKNINVKEAIARRNAEINEQTHRANLLSRTKTTSKTKLFDSNPTMNKTDSQKLSSNSLGDVSDTASIASTNSNFHNKFNTVPRPPSTDPSSESYRPRTVSADSYALRSTINSNNGQKVINSSGESNIIMESQSEDDIRYTSPNTSNVETIQKIDLPRISSNSDFSNNVISLLGKIVSDTKQMTPTLPPTLPPAPPPTNHKDENSDTDSNSSKNTVSVSSRSFTRSVSAGQMVDKGPTTYDAPLTMTQLKEEPTNESIIEMKPRASPKTKEKEHLIILSINYLREYERELLRVTQLLEIEQTSNATAEGHNSLQNKDKRKYFVDNFKMGFEWKLVFAHQTKQKLTPIYDGSDDPEWLKLLGYIDRIADQKIEDVEQQARKKSILIPPNSLNTTTTAATTTANTISTLPTANSNTATISAEASLGKNASSNGLLSVTSASDSSSSFIPSTKASLILGNSTSNMKSSFESLAHESKITSHSLTDLQSVGTGSDKIDKRRMESHPLPSRFTIPLKDQAHSNPDLASTAAGGGSSTPRRTKTVGRDPQTNRFWFIAEDEQGLAFLRAKLAKISSESKASRPASADVESLCSKEEISESTENIGASKIFLPPPPSAALSRVDLSSKADLVGINGNLSVKTDLGDEYAAGGGGDGVESSLNSRLDMTSASNSRLDLVSTDNLYIESNSKVDIAIEATDPVVPGEVDNVENSAPVFTIRPPTLKKRPSTKKRTSTSDNNTTHSSSSASPTKPENTCINALSIFLFDADGRPESPLGKRVARLKELISDAALTELIVTFEREELFKPSEVLPLLKSQKESSGLRKLLSRFSTSPTTNLNNASSSPSASSPSSIGIGGNSSNSSSGNALKRKQTTKVVDTSVKTLPAKDSFTHQTLDELFSTENCTAVVSVDIAGFLKPSLSKTMKIKVPIVVQRCIEFLEKNSLKTAGIFRVPGGIRRVEDIRNKLQSRAEDPLAGAQTHDVATILKAFLRETKEPLLTNKMFGLFIKVGSDVTDDNLKLKLLRLLILFLPQSHFAVFYYLTDFLSKVSMNSESNSMSSANLAVCIGPSLLRKSISTGESQSSFLSQDPTVPSSSSMNSFVSASGNTLDVVADGHALTRRKSLFKSQKNSIVEGKSGALEFVGHSGEATKMTKQELQTNTAIVDLISFCIDHQHELWMIPPKIQNKCKYELDQLFS